MYPFLVQYARVVRVAAILMTCAVLYLRYHYFVDALFASLLVLTGVWQLRVPQTRAFACTFRLEGEGGYRSIVT